MNHDNDFEYSPSHKEYILKKHAVISATEGFIFPPYLAQQKGQNLN